MKAVLMRRHQTMADVVPITTLLAILIYIGYCSDTAGGTQVPAAVNSVQQPEGEILKKSAELESSPEVVQEQLQKVETQLSDAQSESEAVQEDTQSPPSTTPDVLSGQSQDTVQLELQKKEVIATPADDTVNTDGKGQQIETKESKIAPLVDGSGGLPVSNPQSPQTDTTDRAEATADTAHTPVGVKTTRPQSSAPPAVAEVTRPGDTTRNQGTTTGGHTTPSSSSQTPGMTHETATTDTTTDTHSGAEGPAPAEAHALPGTTGAPLTPSGGGVTGLQNTLAAPITEVGSKTAETVIQPPTQNKVTSPTSITTQETTAPTPPTLTAPQQQRITPVSQYTPPRPSTSTQTEEGAGTTADSEISAPVTVKVTAPGDITGSLPETTTTEGATLSATTPRAGDAQTPGTGVTATGHTGNTEAMPAVKGETSLTSKAGHAPQSATGATTLTDVTVKGPQSSGAHTTVTEHTPPVDTAGTLPGTTDSRTTRQGPSPPAGASQASADVTVQQGPTPEEKKEQQKEVTGITPQGSPRQEGQQQKGQTPQGPPPLGSTSGATPGKDNTRETAKTPPTGTDTNNNNNNITIPKIAVNETIISATVVPSAIPAVLVCSVVFLYLSRR